MKLREPTRPSTLPSFRKARYINRAESVLLTLRQLDGKFQTFLSNEESIGRQAISFGALAIFETTMMRRQENNARIIRDRAACGSDYLIKSKCLTYTLYPCWYWQVVSLNKDTDIQYATVTGDCHDV